jgi:dipeptidyl aminopeptidase/acylaminoacyl peptidase
MRESSSGFKWLLVFLWLTISVAAADERYDAALKSKIDSEQNCFSDSFDSYDSWTTALRTRNANVKLELLPSREKFDRYKRELDCRWILYAAADGQLVNGYLIVPRKVMGSTQKLPVVITNHGGNALDGSVVVFGNLLSQQLPLAAEGFIVAGSQRRGIRSRLLGPNRDPGRDEFGGADVKDVTSLIDLVASLPNADGDRVGMQGWSRGGMQALLASRNNDRIRAIAIGGAVTDLIDWKEFRPELGDLFQKMIPGVPEFEQRELRNRSPIAWLEELPKAAPILLIHGTGDVRVPFRQSVAMSMRLHELGRPHELVIIGGGSHGLLEHQQHVDELVTGWFKKYLQQ